MKNSKRALRRHHVERLKKKRKSYWCGYAGYSPKTLGKSVLTPCICSCWMCGNKRKHWGETIQERKIIYGS